MHYFQKMLITGFMKSATALQTSNLLNTKTFKNKGQSNLLIGGIAANWGF